MKDVVQPAADLKITNDGFEARFGRVRYGRMTDSY
jgi:hypothetical protein